jgi:hypothetical protein
VMEAVTRRTEQVMDPTVFPSVSAANGLIDTEFTWTRC